MPQTNRIFGDTSAPRSEVHVTTNAGYGSTNTVICRFTNIEENIGTGITYASSATLGDTFTINETGLYAIEYNDQSGRSANTFYAMGVSRNSNQLTTSIASITNSNRLIGLQGSVGPSGANVWSQTAQITLNLNAGDVIRAHNDGNPMVAGSDFISSFRIVKVNN